MDIEALNLENWKSSVKRRGDNKTRQEVDDILAGITFVDDSSSLDKLPRYCVDNLDDIPIMRMERGEFAILLSKLDKIQENITSLNDGHCHLEPRDRYVEPARYASFINRNVNDPMDQSEPIHATTSRSSKNDSNTVQSRNDHVSSYDVDQSTDCTDNGNTSDGYQLQTSRKKRRIATIRSPPTYADRLVTGQRAASGLTPRTRVVNNTVIKSPSDLNENRDTKKRIIGRATRPNNSDPAKPGIRSAKPYVKKLVFGLYNVEANETVKSIEDFITDICGAQPITCFPVKSRDTESTAFRVCIDAKVSDKFLDADMWVSGIIIRPWKFKPKTVAASDMQSDAVAVDIQSDAAAAVMTDNDNSSQKSK